MAAHVPISPKPRLLSITGCRYEYQLDGRWPRPPEVPYLRLRGYWLQQAGFSVGQRVQVHISEQHITIVTAQ
ncbi:SymE family type I addiction module toxin [Peristeroidobacter soli]|uniref:SymE family type I addiction module toxin n=1 Tax=Peristeroidobacter soli TaxID=2497877 RepID=UPI00101C2B20|nr:SymE family type I addiction module toxin [Peristeroidobacter soli]